MSQFDLDEAQTLARIIDASWGLDKDKPPIEYLPERFAVNARNGLIYVQTISNSTRIDAVDYQSLTQDAHVSVRISARFREDLYRWREEVRRIILMFRRPGRLKGIIGNNTYMELTSTRNSTDLSGWYATVFDIRMVGYCIPIDGDGVSTGIPIIPPAEKSTSSFKWDANSTYSEGSIAVKDGRLYLALQGSKGEAPPSDKWKLLSADESQERISSFSIFLPAGDWDERRCTIRHRGFKGSPEYRTEVIWPDRSFDDCINAGVCLESVEDGSGVFSQTNVLKNMAELYIDVYKTHEVE